jgi:hypothetical protein
MVFSCKPKELIMGFLSDLFEAGMKRAGCDPETRERMSRKSDSELINMARNRTGREQVGACAELKRRYGTDEANEKIRRGY